MYNFSELIWTLGFKMQIFNKHKNLAYLLIIKQIKHI